MLQPLYVAPLGDRLGAITYMKLNENFMLMFVDCRKTDSKLIRDFLVEQTFRQAVQDLLLSMSEPYGAICYAISALRGGLLHLLPRYTRTPDYKPERGQTLFQR